MADNRLLAFHWQADETEKVEDIIAALEVSVSSLENQMETYFKKKYPKGYPRPEVMDEERSKLTIGELNKA